MAEMFNDVFNEDLVDYGGSFKKSDENYQRNALQLGYIHTKFDCSEEDAQAIFDIIKSADGKRAQGFVLDGSYTFQAYWLILDRSKEELDKIPQDVSHSDPFDDSLPRTINESEVLGLYKDKKIRVNVTAIHENHGEGMIAFTILHEFMHAAMDAGENISLLEHRDAYWYYKEEAYANAFALKLLKASKHEDWYNEACEFVKKQPKGYNAGALLVDKPISMEEWRKEKLNPDGISKEAMHSWKKEYIHP